MTVWRRWVIVVAPLPILSASLGLSWWVRTPPAVVVPNRIETFAPHRAARPAAASVPSSNLTARCEEVAAAWRERLGPGHAVIAAAPFIVAGNLAEAEVRGWLDGTILPASRAMARAYFRTPPDAPITILLFRDAASYDAACHRLFGEQGLSVYGYYRPVDRTVVLNLQTGGGTLVHELTHALIAFDFPRVPDWFNEGLASLHEQCRIRPDERGLEGKVNWRLPALRAALAEGRLGSLAALVESPAFRGPEAERNYAQARYLCLFLERRGLLEPFYARFRAAHPHDPTGLATLRETFAPQAWEAVEAEYRAWLADLRE